MLIVVKDLNFKKPEFKQFYKMPFEVGVQWFDGILFRNDPLPSSHDWLRRWNRISLLLLYHIIYYIFLFVLSCIVRS